MNKTKEQWYQAKILGAIELALNYGADGDSEHKMWVIDQMLRSLVGMEKYEEAIEAANKDEIGAKWSTGQAPL